MHHIYVYIKNCVTCDLACRMMLASLLALIGVGSVCNEAAEAHSTHVSKSLSCKNNSDVLTFYLFVLADNSTKGLRLGALTTQYLNLFACISVMHPRHNRGWYSCLLLLLLSFSWLVCVDRQFRQQPSVRRPKKPSRQPRLGFQQCGVDLLSYCCRCDSNCYDTLKLLPKASAHMSSARRYCMW